MRIADEVIRKRSISNDCRNDTGPSVVTIFSPCEFNAPPCRPARNIPSGASVRIMQPYDLRLEQLG